MHDGPVFGTIILCVAAAFALAIASNRLSSLLRIPTPAIFLLVAAAVSDLIPRLHQLSGIANERLVTVALVIILFDGGMQIGLPRFRSAARPIMVLGVAGTVITAAGLALIGHLLIGLDWREALLLATALSPTDPAVVFNVLAGREIAGSTGTILQGESGANDPVGIALMIAILGSSGAGWGAFGHGLATFALQLVVGVAVGVAGGTGLAWVMRHMPISNEGLRPVRSIVAAFLIYGSAAALDGSGFLAVLLAGVIIGEADVPHRLATERFTAGLASLAEIAAFVALGLTVDLSRVFTTDAVWIGLVLFAATTLAVRPIAVALLLVRSGLTWSERAFLSWGGLKGAVPILLGLFAVTTHAAHAGHLYDIVFVVVLASVIVQGSFVPKAAAICRVPMISE
ncbi:cation:proton antiporter [Nocardioides sp.]|jgi:cell volume regulation protein A|uniref:cation:proton antiporter domain-containing protein n=1 Tax=Nocardioides sp. TaxID=35761 RepID=UPI002BD16DA5|nr:cation:proton antiporter [Nocardioides sp.]HVX54944.1 cation:proton antiporter [Nocardioides sp.]